MRIEEIEKAERETIISFNEADDIADVFTYNKRWQKHLEGKLGLKPVMDNGFGGKSYEAPKVRIRPPKAPRKLSSEAKEKLTTRLKTARLRKAYIGENSHRTMRDSVLKRLLSEPLGST